MNTKDFTLYNEAERKVEDLKNTCTLLAFEIATASTTKQEKEATRKWEEAIKELKTAVQFKDAIWEGLKRKATAERLNNDLRYWEKEWSMVEKQMSDLQERYARIFNKVVEARELVENHKRETGSF